MPVSLTFSLLCLAVYHSIDVGLIPWVSLHLFVLKAPEQFHLVLISAVFGRHYNLNSALMVLNQDILSSYDIPLDDGPYLQIDMTIHYLLGCLLLQRVWILENKMKQTPFPPSLPPVFFLSGKLSSRFACVVWDDVKYITLDVISPVSSHSYLY